MQENCVNLQTSEDLPMEALVKTALRMRPDMIIVGEVRGPEANDMMTAMNIGKIAMGTIHASSSRDIVNRLEHTPMKVPLDIIPVIDVLIISLDSQGGHEQGPGEEDNPGVRDIRDRDERAALGPLQVRLQDHEGDARYSRASPTGT